MKNSKKLMRMATMHAFLQTSNMEELAKATAKEFNAAHSGDVEVDSVKENGFTMRRKKDAVITDSDVQNSIRDALIDIIDKNVDDIKDFISENYEFEYDPSIITVGFISDVFDIDRSGRLIYVEVDV